MRYANAPHVDLRALLVRRSQVGRVYAAIGYVGIVVVLALGDRTPVVGWSILLSLVALWFIAWFQTVGSLWRAPLVAAVLIASMQVARVAHGFMIAGVGP